GGINLAQRVMDCGDAGHILISKSVADVLEQMTTWKTALCDLGEVEVKHGVRIHLYNLCSEAASEAHHCPEDGGHGTFSVEEEEAVAGGDGSDGSSGGDRVSLLPALP